MLSSPYWLANLAAFKYFNVIYQLRNWRFRFSNGVRPFDQKYHFIVTIWQKPNKLQHSFSNTQVTKTTSVLPVAEVIWDFGLPISISLFLRLLVGRVAGSIDGYAFVDLKKIRKLFLLFVKSTAIRFSKQIDKFVLLNLNHYEEQ